MKHKHEPDCSYTTNMDPDMEAWHCDCGLVSYNRGWGDRERDSVDYYLYRHDYPHYSRGVIGYEKEVLGMGK